MEFLIAAAIDRLRWSCLHPDRETLFIPGQYDILIHEDDANEVVRKVRKMYEPVFAKLIMPLENHKKSREIFVNESKKMTKQAFKSWVSALAVTNKTLHERCINLRLSLINKCGHACSIEKKHEFNEIVLDFIKEHNFSFMHRRYIELSRI